MTEPRCTSTWEHVWWDGAPHRRSPYNAALELCVECMAVAGMGPEVDHIDRIVSSTIALTRERRWDCLVDGCEWMLRVLPQGLEEGRRRARLHAVSHALESRGAVLMGRPG